MANYQTDATTPPNPSRIHAGGVVDDTFTSNLSKTLNQAHLQKCRQGFANVWRTPGSRPKVEQDDTNFNVLQFFAPWPSTGAIKMRVKGKVSVVSNYNGLIEIEFLFGLSDDTDTVIQTFYTVELNINPSSNSVGYLDHTVNLGDTGLIGVSRSPASEFAEIRVTMKMGAANSNDYTELNHISIFFDQGSLGQLQPYQTKIENTSGTRTYTGYPLDVARSSNQMALSSGQAWTWKQTINALRKMPLCIASMSALRDLPSVALSHLVGDDDNRLSPYPYIHFCRVPITDHDIVIKAYASILNGPYTTNVIRLAAFDINSLLDNEGLTPDDYLAHVSGVNAKATIPYENATNIPSEVEVKLTMPAPTYTIASIPTCRFIAVGLALSSSLYRERFGFNPGQVSNPRMCSYGIWCSIDD